MRQRAHSSSSSFHAFVYGFPGPSGTVAIALGLALFGYTAAWAGVAAPPQTEFPPAQTPMLREVNPQSRVLPPQAQPSKTPMQTPTPAAGSARPMETPAARGISLQTVIPASLLAPPPAEVLILQNQASQGQVAAQLKLGMLYLTAKGVNRNDVSAANWLQRAARQGNAQAQLLLGLMYLEGRATPISEQENAQALIHTSALQNNLQAQIKMAEIYQQPGQDISVALAWYTKAAEGGSPEAAFALGELYTNGRGVVRNEEAANAWFQKALAGGYQDTLGMIYQSARQIVASQGTSSAPETKLWLGQMLLEGIAGAPKDEKRAVELIREAAAQHNIEAQLMLADLYAKGQIMPVPNRVAAYAIRHAAALRSQKAETVAKQMAASLSPKERNDGEKLSAKLYSHPSQYLATLDTFFKQPRLTDSVER